jgi:hypothetical protein
MKKDLSLSSFSRISLLKQLKLPMKKQVLVYFNMTLGCHDIQHEDIQHNGVNCDTASMTLMEHGTPSVVEGSLQLISFY